MNINHISANIDAKLLQLQQQLTHLKRQLIQSDGDNSQLAQDIAVLEKLKLKLEKSRDLAGRAHELQRDNDKDKLQQKRLIGISLCVVCGLGLIALIAIVLFS